MRAKTINEREFSKIAYEIEDAVFDVTKKLVTNISQLIKSKGFFEIEDYFYADDESGEPRDESELDPEIEFLQIKLFELIESVIKNFTSDKKIIKDISSELFQSVLIGTPHMSTISLIDHALKSVNENLPMGAQEDSRAPWNEEDSVYSIVKSDNSLILLIDDEPKRFDPAIIDELLADLLDVNLEKLEEEGDNIIIYAIQNHNGYAKIETNFGETDIPYSELAHLDGY